MSESSSGGISRRRVLVGVAWTTPAIVLAVATPRAAASELDAGTLEIVSASGIFGSSGFTVSAQVAHGGPSGTAPIEGVQLTVVIPTWAVPPQDPTDVSAGWAQTVAPTVGDDYTRFFFDWEGDPLTTLDSAAGPFSASFQGVNPNATPITIEVTGESALQPVMDTAPITAQTAGTAVINTAGGNYSISQEEFFIYFQVRHSGPYGPIGAPVTNLVVEATYDATQVSAPATGQVLQWVVGPAVIVGTVGTVTFEYAGALQAPNDFTATQQFVFPAVNGATRADMTLAGTFMSAGTAGTIPDWPLAAVGLG